MRGLESAGVYLPRFRIDPATIADAWETSHARGIDTKAVAGADEDALTMAVAAGRQTLTSSTVSRDDISFVGFATTTPPLEEESLVPQVVTMLGLPEDVATYSATQSSLAWAQLLQASLDREGAALVVCGDAPEGELADVDHRLGAGGAAFVVDDDATVPVTGVHSHVGVASGIRYREVGEENVTSLDITSYERSAISDGIGSAVEGLDVDLADIDAAALHQPNPGLPYRLGGTLGVETETVGRGTVVERIGDAGVSTVPIGLIGALDAATEGSTTVAADFGSGGASLAFAFEGSLDTNVEAELSGSETLTYEEYLRQRGYVVDPEVAGGGANVSLLTWQRSLDQRYRLVAGRCEVCGELAFPPEGACPACYERVSYEPQELPAEGTIDALTVIRQGGAPPEFGGQAQQTGRFGVAIVEVNVDEGSIRLPVQITDADPDTLAVGDEVIGEIRHIYSQEGLPRYGLKFRPARDTP
jgi:3-hydroxy-3-methylglutaryl CoA synthase/uncharacterized OB-fold protein